MLLRFLPEGLKTFAPGSFETAPEPPTLDSVARFSSALHLYSLRSCSPILFRFDMLVTAESAVLRHFRIVHQTRQKDGMENVSQPPVENPALSESAREHG